MEHQSHSQLPSDRLPDLPPMPRKRFPRRFVITLIALIALLIIGITGYRWLEGLDFVDALYMTVTTVTTVGFGEVKSFSPAGRLFTVGLIVGGASIAAYALSSAAQYVLSGEWQTHLQERRRRSVLEHLINHVIVCGYGRVGKGVVHELTTERIPFVVIDSDLAIVTHLRALGHLAIHGNAADEHLLKLAGIDRARGMVVCASSDAENVYIVLTARELRSDLMIVARASYEDSEAKLLRAGANHVMQPFGIAGRRMVTMLVRPEVADFLDVVSTTSELELLVEQIEVAPASLLAGKTLAESELGTRLGVSVLACRLPNCGLNLRPGADMMLEPHTKLVVLGTRDQLQKLLQLASS